MLPDFSFFWQYAELRTNPLDQVPRFPLKKGQQNSFHVAARLAQPEGISSVKTDPARSRGPLLDFRGQKQPGHRRHSRRKHWHHLQARRTHFEQAQCRKPHRRCGCRARKVPHRTAIWNQMGAASDYDRWFDRAAAR
jgi:hypothetical protein